MDYRMNLKVLNWLGFAFLTAGYIWHFLENSDIHQFFKYFTMQGYFLMWLFYLLEILGRKSLFIMSRDALFELCLIQQMMFCPLYWLLVHPYVAIGNFTPSFINWCIIYHTAPLLLLMAQLYFEGVEIKFRWGVCLLYLCLVGVPINYGN